MRTSLPILAIAVSAGLSACTTSYVSMQRDGVQLTKTTRPDGGSVVYKLLPGQDGAPRIQRTETVKREKADLELLVSSINADLALRLGVQPWVGVHVNRVGDESNAARAGLVAGDILLAMDGTQLVSRQQFEELLSERLRPGTTFAFDVSRETGAGVPRSSLRVAVQPDVAVVNETTADLVPLEYSKGVQRTTGIQAATVPPDLAAEIYGESEPITVVYGVVIGSPAYLAGLRSGDRLTSIDGTPGVSLDALRSAVRARSQGLSLPPDAFETPDAAQAGPSPSPREDRVRIDVLGPLGSHSGAVDVVDDLYEDVSFHFPILFDFDADTDSTRWSFLDFIFQFGANYEGKYVASGTREPSRSTSLSLFPLDMFEFEWRPTYNRYTFLWFITFKTRN
ncbi:MAG: PDZ domain-containing protein [Planctomycetota bacterium JB042]